jgi:hypothetical protein
VFNDEPPEEWFDWLHDSYYLNFAPHLRFRESAQPISRIFG